MGLVTLWHGGSVQNKSKSKGKELELWKSVELKFDWLKTAAAIQRFGKFNVDQ